MLKLSRWWVVLLLALPLLVTSCGDDDDDNGPTGPTSNVDLTVLAVTFLPAAPTTDDEVTASVTVKNTGTEASAGSVVSVTIDGVVRCASLQVGGLSAGQMQTVQCALGQLAAGSRTIRGCADAASTVSETDETNNCLAQTLVVTEPAPPETADLVVQSITFDPPQPTPFHTVTAQITVRNAGSQAAPATTLRTRLDGLVICDAVAVPALAAGASETVNCDLGQLPSGTRQVEGCADAGSTVTEANETNNCLTQTVSVTGPSDRPNLQIEDISFAPGAPQAGDDVTILVSVANVGTFGAGPTQARVSVDGQVLCGAIPVPALAAGGSIVVNCVLNDAVAGTYSIEACADSNGELTETDETDNCGTQSLQVTAAGIDVPDLPAPELGRTVDFCNQDQWAQAAQAMVQGQISAAEAIALLGPALIAGIQEAGWESEGGGCWTAPFADDELPGCSGEYRICAVLGGYEFSLTVTGTCYGGTVTDWKAYDGFVNRDGTEGHVNLYVQDGTEVESAFEWTVASNRDSGTWKWYEGPIAPENLTHQMTFETQTGGGLEMEWLFVDEMRWTLETSADGKTGQMDTHIWEGTPPGWVLQSSIEWANCTGSWTTYSEGQVVSEHNW